MKAYIVSRTSDEWTRRDFGLLRFFVNLYLAALLAAVRRSRQ